MYRYVLVSILINHSLTIGHSLQYPGAQQTLCCKSDGSVGRWDA